MSRLYGTKEDEKEEMVDLKLQEAASHSYLGEMGFDLD